MKPRSKQMAGWRLSTHGLLCSFISWWKCPLRLGWLAVWIQVAALGVNMTAITITWKRQGMPRQLQWLLGSSESTSGQLQLSRDAAARMTKTPQIVPIGDAILEVPAPPCVPEYDPTSDLPSSEAAPPNNPGNDASNVQPLDRDLAYLFLHNVKVMAHPLA
jgi:hypothetical protein